MTRSPIFAAAFSCFFAVGLSAAEWYVSDASGIALEKSTAARALELEHAVSIETIVDVASAPEEVRKAVPSGGSVELRTLYGHGEPVRRRWTAKDSTGLDRVVETRDVDGGITRERYDSMRRFTEESRFDRDGSGTIIRYSYSESRLVRAEAFRLAPSEDGTPLETPLWTQSYRYLRSGALLSVERTQIPPEGETTGLGEIARFDTLQGVPRLLTTRLADGSSSRTRYDASGRVTERAVYDPEGKEIAVTEIARIENEAAGKATSIEKSTDADGNLLETEHDDRGRVVAERKFDTAGALLSETRTTWSDNRIASIETVEGAQTRRTEYEYDGGGNRTMERNFRNGILERTVRRSGDEEIEELYSDGRPVLRAVWVGGGKVSERRLNMGEEADR